MKAKDLTRKKVTRLVGAACVGTGIVACSAVIASIATVGSVAGGFKAAKNVMKKMLHEEEDAV